MSSTHAQPFLIESTDSIETARGLKRFPMGPLSSSSLVKYDEAWLQKLVAAHSEILPIAAIEPALITPFSICTELRTPSGGYLDNLLVTSNGDLVLVECKLWRNPQARREVVGQIIEYAKDLTKWSYEQLDDAIVRSTAPPGVNKSLCLYDRISDPEKLDEAAFVDAVARNLRRGRALLLIVGDGIRENLEALADFLQQHAGLHFTLGLVELAVYEMPDRKGLLICPFVVARTKMVERGVVALADDRIQVQPTSSLSRDQTTTPPRRRVAESITEEKFFERLELYDAGLGAKLQYALTQFRKDGITSEMLTASMRLHGRAADDLWPLGTIQASDASVWFEIVASTANSIGRRDAAIRYYQRLVLLIGDESLRRRKAAPTTKSGVSSLPLNWLVSNASAWQLAMEDYLKAIDQAT